MKDLDFMTGYNITECAAQVFNRYRPSPGDKGIELLRKSLRYPAVQTLRALWKSGDASMRTTVAARVKAWNPRIDVMANNGVLAEFIARIDKREKARAK
jgi:hypothetical protein